MAHSETGKHYHGDIADHRVAIGLLAIKGPVHYQDNHRGYYHHAFGAPAIGTGVLFVAGF